MSGIEVKSVSKYFGRSCALDDINLSFGDDKIYGLLGRNGAGKSTLLNSITGRLFTDRGEVLVDGEAALENDRVLNRMYLMSEKTYYPEKMKVKEAFRWSKVFYENFDEEYAGNLAEQFELNTRKSIKQLSTGFLSIFKLVVALSVNTPYILLDEPVLGLDANNRDLFYKLLLEKYIKNPCTIVISTHLIEEVADIIEEVVIVKKGKIISNEPKEELLLKGYTVSGPINRVDGFIKDKTIIGEDILGGLKTAHILGRSPKEQIPGLEITKLDLQKLFIQLTNS